MNSTTHPNISWLFLMAWRDTRQSRSRLLLFVSSVILGIASLVAIYSLGDNMQKDIDKQAATLIGADLKISSGKKPSTAMQRLTDSLGNRRSSEYTFASMVYFVKSGGSRLTQVRALEGEFPYYGSLETLPRKAGEEFRNSRQALVDRSLMLQYNAKPGDSIKVGDASFMIAGSLVKAPGQTGLTTSIAPVVYIPLQFMKETGLAQKGSRIMYNSYYKFDRPLNIDRLLQQLKPRLDAESATYETIASQKERTGRSFQDLTRFLSLVGFIALLLGCMGVASSIHIYIKEKTASIALMRCLGVKASQSFKIYLVQVVAIGLFGSVLGAAVGAIIQQFMPIVLKDFLPIEITTAISWKTVLQGIGLGVVISVLFALLPLLSIRNISPLQVLRLSFEEKRLANDPLKWLVYLLMVLFVFGFTYLQMNNVRQAAVFTGSVMLAFLVLAGMARLLMWMTRKFFPGSWSYLARQGLSNLFRPNNQTVMLIISIGMGTALVCLLFFVQDILLTRITLLTGGNQPNMVLFDIQSQQKDKVIELARQEGVPVNGTVPIVTMRLEEVNGVSATSLQKDTARDNLARLFKREYRVTYRDSLTNSEKVVQGSWKGEAGNTGGAVPVSIEEGFARRFHLQVGDTMVFNVQGSLMSTVVASWRRVEWNRLQTNFVVVFPKGVLEEAPQFYVLLTHAPSTKASARFQQRVVKDFPNVSVIDLALVLAILDDLLGKIGFVVRFMAGFSMVTALLVLIASVLISKYQRVQETVLLRTLGASRKQVFAITALEYFFLGALASATGIILALAASWGLARFSFQSGFTPHLGPIALVFGFICFLTVTIGMVNSRSVLVKPPLEILRKES